MKIKEKTGFKRRSLCFLVYKNKSVPDMVWQIQLIRHLMLKITPHTTQIFNIKYLLIELAKPYLGQKYILFTNNL